MRCVHGSRLMWLGVAVLCALMALASVATAQLVVIGQ
jgi:hypothetical protein